MMATATKTAPRADERVRQAQEALNRHGFPCGKADGIDGPKTKAAVRRFQIAFAGGRKDLPVLAVDGVLGPKTHAALGQLPYLAPHFTVHEVRSKGDGTCYVDRGLLLALEMLRHAAGQPLHVVSAYRDSAHNKRVGGAARSMHKYGLAADVSFRQPVRIEVVQRLEVFSGIGDYRGHVRHVDLRHLAGKGVNATPDATPKRPARWSY